MAITYREAADAIHRYVQMNPDSENLRDLLLAADQAIWSSGKWWGLHREFFSRVVSGAFAMPSSLGHIVAINVNDAPVNLRGRFFQFHQNGPGTIDACMRCCEGPVCVDVALDLGECPLFFPIHNEKLYFRSNGAEMPDARVRIDGTDLRGNQVYTYERKVTDRNSGTTIFCEATVEEAFDDTVETIYGERLPIKTNQVTGTCHIWGSVGSVTKSVTRSAVDFFVIRDNHLVHVLTMQPHEIRSAIRRYRLPSDCRCTSCVHVIAKVAEPKVIAHDTQPMVAPSMEALRLLAISKDFELNKKKPKQSEEYRLLAIRNLDEHLAETRGYTPTSIQAVGPEFEDQGTYVFQ